MVGIDAEHRVGQGGLVDVGVVTRDGEFHFVGGEEHDLAAHIPLVLAAFGFAGLISGGRCCGIRFGDVRTRESDPALVAVAVRGGEREARQYVVRDRNIGRTLDVEAIQLTGRDLAFEHEILARVARHDRNRAADGVSPEQGALWTLEDLDAIDVHQGRVGPDAAREVHAVHVHADAGVLVEREIVLTDAPDVCGQHGVRSGEGSARIEGHVGRQIAQFGDIRDSLGLQGRGGDGGDGYRNGLHVLGAFLRRDHDFFELVLRIRHATADDCAQAQDGSQTPASQACPYLHKLSP